MLLIVVIVVSVVMFIVGVVTGFALWLEDYTRAYGKAGGPTWKR